MEKFIPNILIMSESTRRQFSSKISDQLFDQGIKHLGQRKLLITELQFLNKYYKIGDIVLYVGACPGAHIAILLELFPKINFVLYDKTECIIQSDRVVYMQKYFDDNEAIKFANRNDILFISDIRNLEIAQAIKLEKNIFRSSKKSDEIILNDLKMQKQWIEMIKPKKSLLKFRLGYEIKDKFKYFGGEIFFQAWGPLGTETRLVPDTNRIVRYDPVLYDENIQYYNYVIRPKKYTKYSKIFDQIGILNNYDSTLEFDILETYLRKFSKFNPKNLIDLHFKITAFLSKFSKQFEYSVKSSNKRIQELQKTNFGSKFLKKKVK